MIACYDATTIHGSREQRHKKSLPVKEECFLSEQGITGKGQGCQTDQKESVQYGKRWNVEIYFSGLKRTMGEVIKAVRPDYIVQENALKVQYYNIMRGMTHPY